MQELESRLAQLEQAVATDRANYNECLDTIWTLLATMLVFYMHSGFSLLEVGSVRFQSSQFILAKNITVVLIGFLSWYVMGYALAFGDADIDPTRFIGSGNFAMDGLYNTKEKLRFWLWQGAFCATAATIASGAMAERTQVKGFMAYTVLMSCIIYPVVAHWGWSGKGIFYYKDGNEMRSITGPALIDFAGSGIVHLVGGVSALVGAVVVGPRLGRFDGTVPEIEFDAHNVPFVAVGSLFLWFGWYGFNTGSTSTMHEAVQARTAAVVFVNTALSPCIAGLVAFFLRVKIITPTVFDVSCLCNGILAGLVSITASCATVVAWEAVIIGAIGGLVYMGASATLRRLEVDDVVDAFAVHGCCGFWGLLAAGLFGQPQAGIAAQFGTQVVAGVLIILWTAVTSLAVFLPLRYGGFLRYGDEFQKALEDTHISMVKSYVDRELRVHQGDATPSPAATPRRQISHEPETKLRERIKVDVGEQIDDAQWPKAPALEQETVEAECVGKAESDHDDAVTTL